MHEDMAAEQKARTTYDNLLRLIDDPDVRDPLKFLREREIVHYQRFGEGLRIATDHLNSKNFYACNPSFDKNCGKRPAKALGTVHNGIPPLPFLEADGCRFFMMSGEGRELHCPIEPRRGVFPD